MPHSPSPDRSYDRRGPPKDWDAPEEEDGEISYTGNNRRSGPSGGGYRDSRAGGGGGRDRDRSRDRRDYRDRAGDRGGRRDDYNRGHRDNDAGGRRDHRDRDRSDRDRDRDRGGRDRDRNRDDKDDKDDEEGSYRRRRDDNMDESDDEKDKGKSKKGEETVGDTDKPLEELTPEEQEARMMAMMGFGGFDSTKGKKVAGADVSGVDIKKQRQYRQYMNRRGGFNRPLDSK
ncbi:hypothetical protein BGZ95_010226 [Linnemannia exigua]|uniref:U4/U6.U5 small nuclear ribonucleoprotein 27kDa protein domain-containing protein n=1 Tax=Linnemannia exigua TaxID=604196 RepID=A0AAD4DK94_9FUNG|nr:hypothetical protein BGZ95_010226 [Linnemannia exigua]